MLAIYVFPIFTHVWWFCVSTSDIYFTSILNKRESHANRIKPLLIIFFWWSQQLMCALFLSTSVVKWWGASRCMWSQGLTLFQHCREPTLSLGWSLHLGVHPSTMVSHRQLLQSCSVWPPQDRVWQQCGRFRCCHFRGLENVLPSWSAWMEN